MGSARNKTSVFDKSLRAQRLIQPGRVNLFANGENWFWKNLMNKCIPNEPHSWELLLQEFDQFRTMRVSWNSYSVILLIGKEHPWISGLFKWKALHMKIKQTITLNIMCRHDTQLKFSNFTPRKLKVTNWSRPIDPNQSGQTLQLRQRTIEQENGRGQISWIFQNAKKRLEMQ